MDETTKMDPEIKTRWVGKLRSGKYEQGRGSLNAGGKFCCLGVLCELAVEAGVIPPAEPLRNNALGAGRLAYTGWVSNLPDEVREWAKLSTRAAFMPSGRPGVRWAAETVLIEMNDGVADGTRRTFPEIADWIRTNL